MKIQDGKKTVLETYFLRFNQICYHKVQAFVMPKEIVFRPGKRISFLEVCDDRKPKRRQAVVLDVQTRRLLDIVGDERAALGMDLQDEIRTERFSGCAYFEESALEKLPEGHPLRWITKGNDFCISCAEKLVDAMRDACVEKTEGCPDIHRPGSYYECSRCPHIVYSEALSECETDSIRRCQNHEPGDENNQCCCVIETSPTKYCLEEEIGDWQEYGFNFDRDADRCILQIVADSDYLEELEACDVEFVKDLVYRSVWDSYWFDKHPSSVNPTVNYHTFRLLD